MAYIAKVSVVFFLFGCFSKCDSQEYGVDVSFPIFRPVSTNYEWLPHNKDPLNNPTPKEYEGMPVQTLGNRAQFYQEYLDGCRTHFGKKAHACDDMEKGRLEMSLRQPQSMQNYTDTGFKKIRAPETVRQLLFDYWEKNKDKKSQEIWSTGNTYTNHWAAPTYMTSVEDKKLRGGGYDMKQKIWDAAQDTIEEWTGMELTPTSMYGIRVYTEGAVLAPHVDRLPLVSSAIVNVAQDVEEDWPLEIYTRDGNAYNVTMKPGDMVLYESHSLIHGRPFPLKGKYFANIFIHFEPAGHSKRHQAEQLGDLDIKKQYREATENRAGSDLNSMSGKLPPYILENSPEEKNWMRSHSNGWEAPSPVDPGKAEAHYAAGTGDLNTLRKLAKEKPHALHLKDANGWQPIHEAARSGHKNIVELLVEHGQDINERTNHGSGGSPLYLATEAHSDDHPLVRYFISIGALNIGPDL